jgi:hypothetical protein
MILILDIITSSTFLNVILNDLKQDTFNGCKTRDECDGKMIKSTPNSYAYSHYENKGCFVTSL